MKTAFIFPGQGAQAPGMGLAIANQHTVAKAAFEEADDALGFSISRLCFDGPEDQLRLTENTQPAILATSIATYRVLEHAGIRPDCVAGHSLGEYSALVAVGGIGFGDALRLVRKRGRYMQEAVPVGTGAMAALVGLELDAVEGICREVAGAEVVAPANINSASQIVVAGHVGAVERAVQRAKEAGARKSVMLAVSAPFHCPLLLPAEDRLIPDLDSIEFRSIPVPLINNVDAHSVTEAALLRDGLKRQVSRPVQWHGIMSSMLGSGVTKFVEVGPGRVLSGLVRSADKSVDAFRSDDEKSLDLTLKAFL